jgi:hypothetical protein
MILVNLSITNFRCFGLFELDNIDRLAIFIGENDVGKTVLLDAISILVSNQPCNAHDFHKRADGTRSAKVIIEGTFRLEDHDTLPPDYRSGDSQGLLKLKKRFTESGMEVFVLGRGLSDDRFDDFSTAEKQKSLLQEYGLTPGSNETKRREQRDELLRDGKLRYVEKEIKLPNFNSVISHLPRIERFSASDYRTPVDLIQSKLRSVAASVLKPEHLDEETAQLLFALREIERRIQQRLNKEIEKVKNTLTRQHDRLKSVSVIPSIDFTKSVGASDLQIDLGEGERPLDQFGDGTKRRMWMGLLEWERETAQSGVSGGVIRLYDEPDINLHYEAQRKLFKNIYESVANPELHTQCFVCTHSVSLIDRAPSKAINLIRQNGNSSRDIRRIASGDNGSEVISFFNEIGRTIGLTNTAILYERGFLVVEGETENDSIPILYRALYGRSITEDGIVIINLHTCSAWKGAVEFLLKNRMEMTHFLLDTDCNSPDSSAHITKDAFEEFDCDENFLLNQVTFVGSKEFEDSFAADLIALALDESFPREDGLPWDSAEIQALKDSSSKFSDDLRYLVVRNTERRRKSSATKPGIAVAVAKKCDEVMIPAEIRRAFESLRLRAGIDTQQSSRTLVN